jgi:ADP-ribose pyrophosphatase
MLKFVAKQTDGFVGRRIRVTRDLVETQNHKQFTYEVVKVADAVAILPVLPNGNVLLIKNFRYPVADVVLEVPAGKLEVSDADPLSRAKAELEEEVGYISEVWKPAGIVFSSPGITSERIHLFFAYDLQKTQQKLEDSELGLEVAEFSASQIYEMLLNLEVKDQKTNILLLRFFYGLDRL